MTPSLLVSVVASVLVAACGGSRGSNAAEPTAGTSCEAAAGPMAVAVVDTFMKPTLEGTSEAHQATVLQLLTANYAAACTESAWTEAQRSCFAASTTGQAVRACTGSFEPHQTEAYGDAGLRALKDAEAQHGGDAPAGAHPSVPGEGAPAGRADGE